MDAEYNEATITSNVQNDGRNQNGCEVSDVIDCTPYGDPNMTANVSFDIVSAHVSETGGKKHVIYSIEIKDLRSACPPSSNHLDSRSVVINRRYSDFAFVYESMVRNIHTSSLLLSGGGNSAGSTTPSPQFAFPKKVLIGNFNPDVIEERRTAFQKFLQIIGSSDKLLFSPYVLSFLSSYELNESISFIKLGRYSDALPLMDKVFLIREKLLSIVNVHVYICIVEIVALAHSVGSNVMAFSYALLAESSYKLLCAKYPQYLSTMIPYNTNNKSNESNHESTSHLPFVKVIESYRVPFLQLAVSFTQIFGQVSKQSLSRCGFDSDEFSRQLEEIRYASGKVCLGRTSLMEAVREHYIHRTTNSTLCLQ